MGFRLTTGVPRAAVLLCGLGLVACGSPAPVRCTSMEAPSALVTSASQFRVDVYATSSHCTDAGGPAGTPVLTRSFAQGQPLTFSVAPGRRPVVLTSFDAAQVELGTACAETDFGQGQSVCLDLHLEVPVDLSTSSPDLSPMLSCADDPTICGTGACCDKLCWDPTSDITHCGGCRACDSTQVAMPSCMSGLCRSSCVAGFGNCVQPAAPAADDGCETALTTSVSNCGACGRACSTAGANTASCAAGLCNSTCAVGFSNCTQPVAPAPDDGCETPTSSSTTSCGGCARACASDHVQTLTCASGLCTSSCAAGYFNCSRPAAPAADDGCECAGTACCGSSCQTNHANGLGQNFLDCVAPNTYTDTQASAARTAWGMVSTSDFTDTTNCGDGTPMVCRQTASSCACWGYNAGVVKPGTGHVHLNNASNGCMCPGAGDATWN
jgi:hypothetical protein